MHLGLGATALPLDRFDGTPEWYEAYSQLVASDGVEGRLVTMHAFDASWDVWECHPKGDELVVCIDGQIDLIQEIEGEEIMTSLEAGQYAINSPGVWHTADVAGPTTVLFITAGVGTGHRPREVTSR